MNSTSAANPLNPRTFWLEIAAVAFIAIATLLGVSRFDSTIYNNYVLLADAFVHGHVYIWWPGAFIDAVEHDGRYYIIEGPVPALLLMPVVAFAGRYANQTAFACVIAGLSIAVAWHIARRLGLGAERATLFATFFAFGTDLAWCAIYGAVWYVAHIVAVFFSLLAVAELVGRRRAWLITFWLALAAGSRFTLSLAIVPLATYALWSCEPKARLRAFGAMAAVLAVAVTLDIAYNYARWGGPNDIGYVTWYHQDQIGEPTGSPFRLVYFPYELHAFFLSFPTFTAKFPYIMPRYDAVALEFTSPALVLAFFARGERALIATLWLAALLVAIPSFLYYANGGTQFGMRHALDFIPFLFPLMVMATRRVPRIVTDTLCVYSIAVGLWGIWYWRTYYDQYLVHKLPPGFTWGGG